jgi:hypothetical protein
MNIQVRYGYFKSEPHRTHLWIKVDRDGYCMVTSAIISRYNILLQDVTRHTFVELSEDSCFGMCEYSPTGGCYTYDEVRWTSLDVSFSDWLVYSMLVERLNLALRDDKQQLTSEEQVEILRGMAVKEEWEG